MKIKASVIGLVVVMGLTLLLFFIFHTANENSIAISLGIPTDEKAIQKNKILEYSISTKTNSSKPEKSTVHEHPDKKQKPPFIVQCKEIDWTSEENKKRSFALDDKLNNYLTTSNLEDDRLIQAIVGGFFSNESNQKLLSQFVQDFPNNNIGQLALLNQCISKKSDPDFCKSINIEMIEGFAEDNGMFWFNLALFYDAKNQQGLAENALKQSLNSPTFSFYFGETVGYINQALIRAGEPNDAMTKTAAIGYMAAMAIPYLSPFSSLCNSRSEKDFEFYELCMGVSKQLATKADTLILKHFGEQFAISLKKKHQKLIGVEDDNINIISAIYSNEVPKQMSTYNIMMYDNQLADFWFNALIKYGELEAIESTYNEAIRLSKNPNYNPCPK